MNDLEGWPWQPNLCPADEHFIEWASEIAIGQTVFHMGTGLHHKVGTYVASRGAACVGLTASPAEALAYYENAWCPSYQLLLGTLFELDLRLLPEFDIMTLFHVGEMAETYGQVRDHDNALDALIGRVSRGGLVLFYSGSSAWERLRREYLLRRWEVGALTFPEPANYKSLVICRRP